MITGIICAMAQEIALLKKDVQIRDIQTIADRDFYLGTLYGKEVVLVMSRIGKVAASMTATLLIDHFQVERIIFSGTAGGIAPSLHVGDVVIGDRSVQHDFDLSGGDRFRVPLIDVTYFASDPALTQAAVKAVTDYVEGEMLEDIPKEHLEAFHIQEPKAVVGTIASGDQFISDRAKNRWLAENLENLQCVEMEGAAVAQVSYEFHIPFAIVRVISDCANSESSVDFDEFVKEAACHFTRGTIRRLLEGLAD